MEYVIFMDLLDNVQEMLREPFTSNPRRGFIVNQVLESENDNYDYEGLVDSQLMDQGYFF